MHTPKAATQTAPRPAAPAEPAAPLLEDPPFAFQRRWFFILLALFLVSRLALLLLSRRYLMSDESVVGVMAIDIGNGGKVPFFLYNQSYGGGHVVEALLMVPWFKLFGPQDLIVKGMTALVGCLHWLVVYRVLHRFFSKRLALLTLAIYGFSCVFTASNFLVSGGMTTWLFAWIGLYFFFENYYGEKPRLHHLLLAGAALGFAVYCYDYALFYVFGVIGLMALQCRLALWRRWREFATLGAGLVIGALPLIVFNFKYDFATVRRLLNSAGSEQSFLTVFGSRIYGLLAYDFPKSFNTEINTFVPRAPWPSWVCWFTFLAALAYVVIVNREPILRRARGLFARQAPAFPREERILCILYFFMLYAAIYCLTDYAGKSPRYVLNYYPFLPILFAWAILHLGRARRGLAIGCALLFMAPQFWFVGRMATDKTVTEWNITMHGEDIKKVARFLEENRLTSVLAPYEIKWKLMFYSNHRIDAAAIVFGYDRENDYGQLALDRINQGRAPLAIVLDKERRLPDIPFLLDPKGIVVTPDLIFDVNQFHTFLTESGIQCKLTTIGDFVVYHNFSRFFRIYPGFYRHPPQP